MKVSIVKELRRVLHSSESMMLLAMYHGQVTVDGHVVRPKDDERWTREQLAGRMAKLYCREGKLFVVQEGQPRTPLRPIAVTVAER